MLEELEQRIADEYKRAATGIQEKLMEYLKAFRVKDKQMKQNVDKGIITEKQYYNWRKGQIIVGERWLELQTSLAIDLHNANVIAKSIITGYMPEVFALNHDFETYRIESKASVSTSYTLYDRPTVVRLLRDNPDLLPPPGKKLSKRIAAGLDVAWNKQQLQSVATQSILQGESIPEIAHRVAETMGEKNMNAAIRDARTMTTGAENAGRVEAMKRAEDKGIKLRKGWLATLDGRTRHAHRQLDGQMVGVDESFEVDGQKIRFPGDPHAAPYLTWNCRCTLLEQIQGFELDVQGFKLRNDPNVGGMSYQEWKNAKGNETFFKKARNAKKDRDEYYKMRRSKVKGFPNSFEEFQQMKYEKPDDWKSLKKIVAEKQAKKAKK